MYKYLPITDVYAREILDSRGNPTIEVEVLAGDEFPRSGSELSGASTGKYEALELRDKEERYGGLGVQQAADHVNARIAPEVIGMNVLDQAAVDQTMIRLDGTKNKSNLGANASFGVSFGDCRKSSAGRWIAAVFVSWRYECKETSGSDDEYHERGKTCR